MKLDRRQFVSLAPFALGAATAAQAQPDDIPQTVKLRGRIVCLTEELQRQYQVQSDCDARGHVYALKTAEGKLYPILPTDSAAAVWLDQRYRERELQITARLFPQTAYLEVIRYQSWRDGKLHDLDYYCAVCNITEHKPGPCVCCQDPVEFRELPAADH